MWRSDVLITGRLLIAVCARNMEDFCSGVNGRGLSPAHKGHSFISHWQRVRLFVSPMIWHSKGSALALKCTVHMAHLEKKAFVMADVFFVTHVPAMQQLTCLLSFFCIFSDALICTVGDTCFKCFFFFLRYSLTFIIHARSTNTVWFPPPCECMYSTRCVRD